MDIFRSQPWFNRSTATAAAGAATLDRPAGEITSEGLTTAAAAYYTLTLTNAFVNATSKLVINVKTGTNTKQGLVLYEVTPAAGSVVIIVRNDNAAALDGTIVISFVVLG